MYLRALAPKITAAVQKYRAVIITGPRQSGKTTLCRSLFGEFKYLSLEDPDLREFATQDPRGFLSAHAGSLILDEIQRVPTLLAYLQGILDAPESSRRFVLTGSQNFILMNQISQSLAGRTRIFNLLPLSQAELNLGGQNLEEGLDSILFRGGYPRIHDQQLDPTEWLGQYFQTYVERDVRTLQSVSDLDLFDRFLRLTAGRAGQLLNLASLGNDCGISQPTARAWFSLLKTSFIAFQLEPHFANFNKRLTKTPKPYFYDTGLLCYLLRITNPSQLLTHPLRGAIFENWVIAEQMKAFLNDGLEAPLYFWRDQKGHEVDLIIDRGTVLYPIEIKSAATFTPSFVDGLDYLNRLQNHEHGEVIYGGESSHSFKNYRVRSWRDL